MAAVTTGMTRDGRSGDASRSGLDARDTISLTDTYWVTTTDGTDSQDVAMLAAGVPRLGDIHPRINSLRVSRISAQQVDGRTDRWRVLVTYEQDATEDTDLDVDFEIHRIPVQGGSGIIRGALDSPGLIAWQGEANWGEPCVNSAGEQFIPVPEDEEAYLVLRFSRNEWVTNLNTIKQYTNSLNSLDFLGGKPRTWHMMVRAKPIMNSITRQWRVEYLMRYNKLTWDLRLLDQGRYYRATPGIPPAGARIPFVDDHQDNVLGNLDGQGGALAAGLPPSWIRLVRKEIVDWTPLNIDVQIALKFALPLPPPQPLFPKGLN